MAVVAGPRIALQRAHSDYIARNPISRKAHRQACDYLPGGNTRTVLHAEPFPLTFVSGHGCNLTSVDQETYIDFLGEYTAGVYGHNNATIRAAIEEVLQQGWSFGGTNLYEKELAQLVCNRFWPAVERVRFTNSGTEANMMAVAAALAWTGRKKVLVFDRGYHGATLSFHTTAAGSVSKNVNLPHEWIIGIFNDIEKTRKALLEFPEDSLAAILVEPMQGSGGAIPGSYSFLIFLREYASAHGALLIFDEVMTSRLSYRGLSSMLRIQPDLMTLGKWVGGGMSFGAFGGRMEIMAMFDPRNGSLAHAGTFNNNVISMAAGCAGCKLFDRQQVDRLNDLGELMKRGVQDVINDRLQITNSLDAAVDPKDKTTHDEHGQMWISGLGSILAVHFAASPNQSTLQSLFYHHMLAEHIYLAERGFIALNIELTTAHVNTFIAATGRFVKKYRSFLVGAHERSSALRSRL